MDDPQIVLFLDRQTDGTVPSRRPCRDSFGHDPPPSVARGRRSWPFCLVMSASSYPPTKSVTVSKVRRSEVAASLVIDSSCVPISAPSPFLLTSPFLLRIAWLTIRIRLPLLPVPRRHPPPRRIPPPGCQRCRVPRAGRAVPRCRRDRPVEDQVLAEAGDGKVMQVGVERFIRLVARCRGRACGPDGRRSASAWTKKRSATRMPASRA